MMCWFGRWKKDNDCMLWIFPVPWGWSLVFSFEGTKWWYPCAERKLSDERWMFVWDWDGENAFRCCRLIPGSRDEHRNLLKLPRKIILISLFSDVHWWMDGCFLVTCDHFSLIKWPIFYDINVSKKSMVIYVCLLGYMCFSYPFSDL